MTQPPSNGPWNGPDQYGQQGDPYAQQYNPYQRPQPDYQQSQPWQGAQPAGPPPGPDSGWNNQPPKNDNRPLIIGITIAVVGAIVAGVIFFVARGGDEEPIADTTSTAGVASASGSSGETEEPTSSEKSTPAGFPDDIPLPDGVEITTVDDSSSYVLRAEFESDGSEADYDEWEEMFEDEGYDTGGSEYYSDTIGFIIRAENDTYELFINFTPDDTSYMNIYLE